MVTGALRPRSEPRCVYISYKDAAAKLDQNSKRLRFNRTLIKCLSRLIKSCAVNRFAAYKTTLPASSHGPHTPHSPTPTETVAVKAGVTAISNAPVKCRVPQLFVLYAGAGGLFVFICRPQGRQAGILIEMQRGHLFKIAAFTWGGKHLK